MAVRFQFVEQVEESWREAQVLRFRPVTFILGRPKDLLKVASISTYRGPMKALRPIPGRPGMGPGVAPAMIASTRVPQ